MKKIKEFFIKFKNRFLTWLPYIKTAFKPFTLFLMVCLSVFMIFRSCSSLKSFEHASAASSDSSGSDSIYLYSSVDVYVNYNPQLYVNNGNTTLTKFIADISFRVFNNKWYLIKGNDSYDLSNYHGVDSPEIPLYYYVEDGDSYTYSQCLVRVLSLYDDSASDILKGNLTLSSVSITNVVSNNYQNMFKYEFYADETRVLDITFNRLPLPPSGFDFSYVSSTMGLYPWVKLTVNYKNVPVSSPDSDTVYKEGYNAGFKAGRTNGYSDGLAAGKTEGYNDGYSAGKTDGVSEGYESGYSEGYSKGKTDGDSAGYLKGYNAGVKKGYEDGLKDNSTLNASYDKGFQAGYNKGISETLDDVSPWGVLVNAVDTFFNAKIFGTISLGLLFELGLGVILFGFVIKLFYGG